MKKSLIWRTIAIVVVIGISVWGIAFIINRIIPTPFDCYLSAWAGFLIGLVYWLLFVYWLLIDRL